MGHEHKGNTADYRLPHTGREGAEILAHIVGITL